MSKGVGRDAMQSKGLSFIAMCAGFPAAPRKAVRFTFYGCLEGGTGEEVLKEFG